MLRPSFFYEATLATREYRDAGTGCTRVLYRWHTKTPFVSKEKINNIKIDLSIFPLLNFLFCFYFSS